MNRYKVWLCGTAAVMLTTTLFWSCDNGENTEDNFDRTALLEHVADDIIIPQYTNLQGKVNALKSASDAFTTNTNDGNLATLQSAWLDAYKAWQYANAFNFGPAGEEGLRKGLIEEAGTFPVSETKIEANITNNNTNMSDFNRDARGFLAVEYLIFRVDDDNTTVLGNFESANRRSYLTALVNKLKSQIDDVVAAWNGSYKQLFISRDGTDVGSSTSQYYNEFVKSFESIKNFKVGLPMGLRPGQVQTEPQLVEAYYSGTSVPMLKEHLQAIENIWYGKSTEGEDGIGFKEYLESVSGGPALITLTEAQLAEVNASLDALPEDERLSLQLNDNAENVETFYEELQIHTRYFKSDMSSLLGIAITFSSGDGD